MPSPPSRDSKRRPAVRTLRALLVAGTALCLFIAGLPGTASAHGFNLIKMDDPSVDFASDEDNLDHHLFWNHFVHFQQFNEYGARTVLTMVEQERHRWNDGTDVVWFAAPLAGRTIGAETCRKVNGAGR